MRRKLSKCAFSCIIDMALRSSAPGVEPRVIEPLEPLHTEPYVMAHRADF